VASENVGGRKNSHGPLGRDWKSITRRCSSLI